MKAAARYAIGIRMIFVSGHLMAQDTAAQRHEMATNQLKRLAAEMTAQCLNGIRSLDDWKKQQPELRRQLLDMLGLDPLPRRTPLKAQITGSLPEVAGAFAPRRLVSLTKFPESFEQVRSSYRLQRASDRFVQSASLPEALEIWKYSTGNHAP